MKDMQVWTFVAALVGTIFLLWLFDKFVDVSGFVHFVMTIAIVFFVVTVIFKVGKKPDKKSDEPTE